MRNSCKTGQQSYRLQFPTIEGVQGPQPLIYHCIVFVEKMFGRQEFLEEMAFKPDGLADSDSWGKHLILDFNTKHVGLELCNLYCSPPKLSAIASPVQQADCFLPQPKPGGKHALSNVPNGKSKYPWSNNQRLDE